MGDKRGDEGLAGIRQKLRLYSDEHSENPKRGIETTLETNRV